MFNYTKEVIINDPSIIKTVGDVVVVKRGGNYDLNKIVGDIMKTPGNAGVKASATITPMAVGDADVIRYTIYLSTPGTEFVEFGSPNWQEFGKPIIVETRAATDVAVADAFRLAIPSELATITTSAGTVVITAAETWMDFAEVNCDLVTFDACGDCMKEVVENQNSKVVVIHNTPEFATAKWIVENLRFPSHPNLRYTPLYADEAPVAGVTYTEYSFEYKVTRSVPGGLSAVGQVVDSIVRIVFYVNPAAETAFETAFGAKSGDGGAKLDTTNYKV